MYPITSYKLIKPIKPNMYRHKMTQTFRLKGGMKVKRDKCFYNYYYYWALKCSKLEALHK